MRRCLFAVLFGLFITPLFATGIDANATSADCDNATLGQYNGTANLEMDWQPNTINVRWYSDDTQLSVPTNAQTCSYGGDLYLPTPPTKKGYTFEGWKVTVPIGYTELEYLQSTGTQYINTGLTNAPGTNEIKVISKVLFPNFSNNNITENGSTCFYISEPKSGLQVYLNRGRMYNQHVSISVQTNTEYVIETVTTATFRSIKVNDFVTSENFNRSITDNSPIYTFGSPVYSNGTYVGAGIIAKLYYQKFYINDELARNFIPARRNSDNELGLYDTVTGTFFTNDGSGTFIAGPVVQ